MSTITTNSLREWLDRVPDSVSPDGQAEVLLDLLDTYEDLADSMADHLERRREVRWCIEHEQGSAWEPVTCCNSYYDDELGKCGHSVPCRWMTSWLVLGVCPKCGGDSWEPYECDACDGRGKPR